MHSHSPLPDETGIELVIKGKTFFLHDTLLGAPYPRTLSLESTNFCNLSCSHCGHSQFPEFSKGHFDMKYFQKVEHLLGSKIKGISLSDFGEPLISKVWHTLLSRVLSIDGLHISFVTNALLLDKHLDEILDPRISIAISIDGASEKTYGYFRGKNNFSKFIANLTLLKNLKDKRGVSFPYIIFIFTVSRINCHELTSIIELAKTFGVETVIVQFQLFFNPERFERESLYFAQDDYNRNIAFARRKALELGINLIHPDSFDGETIFPRDSFTNSWLGRDKEGSIQCFSQLSTCYIKHNGVVEACCAPNHYVMGDLNSNSLDDIWHGSYYRELRLAFDRGEWPDRCKYCNIIQALDVHDKRAHLVEVLAMNSNPVSLPQKYHISKIDRMYKEALSFLPKNHKKAFNALSHVVTLDENLYEIGNTTACLYGMSGNIERMHEQLGKSLKIAPKDPIIIRNYDTIGELIKKHWFRRMLKL
ncbi:MAG: radical SAM protein [Nitrospirota bacterium]|nr:radical SAM protein [Nitrospirota bacterium]